MANEKRSWLERAKDKILRLNDTPERIALGFSIGAFIGIFPTFYLGGVLTIALCALFKLNYAAGVLGAVIVMNPLTTPIFWVLSTYVGSSIWPSDVHFILHQIKNGKVFKSLGEISLVYLTGNLIVASIVAVVSYYLVKRLVTNYRQRKKLKTEN